MKENRTRFILALSFALSAYMPCVAAVMAPDGVAVPSRQTVAAKHHKQPLVIGHRGMPGFYPEETLPSYLGAVDAGADALEEDLHMTKDCVLVARHNPWLGDNTNIAAIAQTNPAVAARKRTVPGRLVDVKYDAATYGGPRQYLTDFADPADPKSVLKSLVVDGEDHTNDWAVSDFTAFELKQWIGGTTYDAAAQRPSELNGQYPILTMQEIFDFAKTQSAVFGRTIATYPEAKNPVWNDEQAVANGCGSGPHPYLDAFVKLIVDNGLNSKSAPIFVQSFDPEALQYMRSIGLATKVVQLIDGNAIDFKTGATTYRADDANHFVSGRPYSWTLAGDPRYFDSLITLAGLAHVKTYADGIGPWKPQAMRFQVVPAAAKVGAATTNAAPHADTLADVNLITPTSLIADAHKAGLFVHIFTFRNEAQYLAGAYKGDPAAEYLQFFKAGADGVFTDFSNTAVAARKSYLGMGR